MEDQPTSNGLSENRSPAHLTTEYDRLRTLLRSLSAAPVRDMAEIASVMQRLDEVHAAFKAAHGGVDAARY